MPLSSVGTAGIFFFQWHGAHRDLHSFPTRRSSDLIAAAQGARQLDAAVADALEPADQEALRIPQAAHFAVAPLDRKSTRLNSSHPSISYAVFCLKKKTRRSA